MRSSSAFLMTIVFLTIFLGTCQTASAFFFHDDFETGLDPSKWYLENIHGATWQHTTVGGNGCMVSAEPSPWEWGNRSLDVMTQYDNFSDFTMTWDMMFTTESYNGDLRSIYFRGNNDPNVLGYWIGIGVGRPYPYDPSDQLTISRLNSDYSWEYLTPTVSYPWVLNQWHSFKLQAVGNEFKLKVWDKGNLEPVAWTLTATDTVPGGYSAGRIGFGNYWASETYVDNVGVIPEPSTFLQLGVGVVLLLGFVRRRVGKRIVR